MKQKASGIFYGWWIVASCVIIALYTSGVVGYGFTAVFKPIQDEFKWSYAQVSFAASLRAVETGLFAPFVGILSDRLGARKLLFIGGIILSLGLILLARVHSLLTFYAAFALISVGLSGCSSTVMMTVVASWFHRKASLTLGIMNSGYGFAGLMVPLVVALVALWGWRYTMLFFGVGTLLVVLPLALVIKDRPQKYGYYPDGEPPAPALAAEGVRTVEIRESTMGIRDALKSHTFLFISLAMAAQTLIVAAVNTHVMPYLLSVNTPLAVAGLAATLMPIISIAGRFGFGWFGARFGNRNLTIFGFILMALGLVSFAYTDISVLFLIIFLVCFGIGFGGTNTMRGVLARESFGAENFGAMLGFVTGVGTIGGLIGAPLAGYVFDASGNYKPVWLAFGALSVLCLIGIAMTPRAKR